MKYIAEKHPALIDTFMAKGLSKTAIAQELDITTRTLSRWEEKIKKERQDAYKVLVVSELLHDSPASCGKNICEQQADMITVIGTDTKYCFHKKDFLSHQWEFISCVGRIKALVAGYGAGKTYAFLFETLKQHLSNRNSQGISRGWIIYPTFDLAEDLFIAPFTQLLECLDLSFKYNKASRLLTTVYGTIRLFSLQTPARMVGAELTYVGFDEFDTDTGENAYLAYQKALGRLRGAAQACLYIVTTPEGFKTTYRLFVEENNGDKVLIKAKTTDNPFLPCEYIQTLEAQYDKQLIKQYIKGEFVNLNNAAAYYAFERQKNVVKTTELSPGEIYIGMDFNVNPMTAVCAYFDKQTLLIFAEIYLKNSNTFQMAKLIAEKFAKKDIVICPDMTGIKKTTSSRGGYSDISILKSFGFRINGASNPFVRDRLNVVNAVLDSGKVLIMEHCTKLIKDLEQVIIGTHGEIDKSNLELTHISDALGYLIYRCLGHKKGKWQH